MYENSRELVQDISTDRVEIVKQGTRDTLPIYNSTIKRRADEFTLFESLKIFDQANPVKFPLTKVPDSGLDETYPGNRI